MQKKKYMGSLTSFQRLSVWKTALKFAQAIQYGVQGFIVLLKLLNMIQQRQMILVTVILCRSESVV